VAIELLGLQQRGKELGPASGRVIEEDGVEEVEVCGSRSAELL
jgi:hypothetical protein